MKSLKAFLLSITFLASLAGQAFSNDGVAKAIILRGTVKAKIDGKVVQLKKGAWIKEGAMVATADKSFVKLLFIDKSSMNLGPNSQMQIKSFPKKDAGVISLMKGQLRSKVTKNYMDIKDKNKSKLFIKTKTAAMGVRGTDFQVNYNPINQTTALVTFAGAVAMAQLSERVRDNQRDLEKIVNSSNAVIVKKGQYSGASPKQSRVTIPVKISPAQLETMKSNDVPGAPDKSEQASAKPAAPAKQFRSVVPPGVDSKAVANEAKVDTVVAATVGTAVVKAVQVEIKQEEARDNYGPETEAPPPEGMYNAATGALAPKAGGYIDMTTALYVPPPQGSAFDAGHGVYVPPPEVGTIDPATGDYKNDHYKLQPDGSYARLPSPETVTADQDGRRPASKPEGGNPEMPTGPTPPPPPKVDPTLPPPDIIIVGGPSGPTDPYAPVGPEGPDKQVDTDEYIDGYEQDRVDQLNNPEVIGTTRAIFNFNVQ